MSCSTDTRVAAPRAAQAGCSAPVVSNQADIHDALARVVDKHARARYARPVSAHQQACFAELDQRVAAHGGPVVLDSGCGIGESTRVLTRRFPDHLVIGIDKSAVRSAHAARHASSTQAIIARGDCIDIWRLAARARWPVTHHFLLYPNPWPKAKHLKRRWHAHPVFPALVRLGGRLELRSNWLIYVREFELALARLDIPTTPVETLATDTAITPFERKYRASGHRLYRLVGDLRATAGAPTGGRD